MSDQSVAEAVETKNPQAWKDEPMTGAQASYLKALSEEAGEKFYESLTKAQASAQIDSLRRRRDAKTVKV